MYPFCPLRPLFSAKMWKIWQKYILPWKIHFTFFRWPWPLVPIHSIFLQTKLFSFLLRPFLQNSKNWKIGFFFLKPFLFKNMRFIKFSVFELMRSDWLIIEVLRPKLKFSTEVRVPISLLSLMSLAEGLVVPFFPVDLKSIWTWQWMSHFILSKVVPVQKKVSKMIF